MSRIRYSFGRRPSCLHSERGETIPVNMKWKDIIVGDEDNNIPGYSITEWHWERDKAFEDRLLEYYSKMGDKKYTNHTMDDYQRELADAERGIRENNRYHLNRIFNKAFDEVYRGGDWGQPEDQKVPHDRMVSFFLKTEGVIRI